MVIDESIIIYQSINGGINPKIVGIVKERACRKRHVLSDFFI